MEALAAGLEQVLWLEELEMVHRRCLLGGRLAIVIVEVVLIEQGLEKDHPCLEDPSRSTAKEQLVLRLKQQVEYR